MNAIEQHEQLTTIIEQEVRARRHRAAAPNKPTPHPSGERLYDYALGWLDSSENTEIQRHLAVCPACVRELGAMLKFEQSLENEDEQPSLAERAALWMSKLWMPLWAGELVTAADIPTQTHRFEMEAGSGEMTVTCFWRGEDENAPAYLHIAWRADMQTPGEFRARFVSAETQTPLVELTLGRRLYGEKTFTSQELGFDPSRQRWGIGITLAEVDSIPDEDA